MGSGNRVNPEGLGFRSVIDDSAEDARVGRGEGFRVDPLECVRLLLFVPKSEEGESPNGLGYVERPLSKDEALDKGFCSVLDDAEEDARVGLDEGFRPVFDDPAEDVSLLGL